FCCTGSGAWGNAARGGQAPGAGGLAELGAGLLIVLGLSYLGQLGAWVLKLGGSILCLASPAGYSSRTLARVGLILIGVEAVLTVVQLIVSLAVNGVAGLAGGGGNPIVGGMDFTGAVVGQLVLGLAALVVWLAWLFIIGLYVRSI